MWRLLDYKTVYIVLSTSPKRALLAKGITTKVCVKRMDRLIEGNRLEADAEGVGL
jgi:hypothetical protein